MFRCVAFFAACPTPNAEATTLHAQRFASEDCSGKPANTANIGPCNDGEKIMKDAEGWAYKVSYY